MTAHFHSLLATVTDIGDGACLMGITVAAGVYLYARSSGRAAWFIITAFLFAAGLIGIAKIAFLGCRFHLRFLEVHSPSGHAACCTAVFGALSVLMRSRLEARRRFLPFWLLWLLVLAIAFSRVMLGYHTVSEVVIGVIVGLLALWLARFTILRGQNPGHFDAYALALWAVVAAFLCHGWHFPGEAFYPDAFAACRAICNLLHRLKLVKAILFFWSFRCISVLYAPNYKEHGYAHSLSPARGTLRFGEPGGMPDKNRSRFQAAARMARVR